MKKIIGLFVMICILTLCMGGVVSATSTDATPLAIPTTGDVWDGTTLQPSVLIQKDGVYYYEITKCSELAFVANQGGSWSTYNYILGNNLIFNDVVLTFDDAGMLTNTENLLSWKPIDSFSGKFDGANYIVSGLTNKSMFVLISENAIIQNLNIVNSYVTSSSCGNEVGGIAGANYGGYIINCSFEGLIKYTYASYDNDGVGGIVGFLNFGTVENCKNYGTVIAGKRGGGIVGECEGDVIGCSNYGNIKTTGTAGGIIAHIGSVSGAEFDENSNYGDVFTTGGIAGGIIGSCGGWTSHRISNSNNYGRIESTNTEAYVGGICGYLYGCCVNCLNYGEVLGGTKTGGICGEGYYGGGLSNCVNYANVTGYGAAGGLCGYMSKNHSIDRSANMGEVTGTYYVGGILGEPGDVSSAGSISNCYNTGAVNGVYYVGGLLGKDSYYNIDDCYNIGIVSGEDNIGGIAGDSDYIWGKSSVSNNYYLSSTSYGGIGGLENSVGVVESKTSDELKKISTFESWDFGIWAIASDKNGGYPYLRWQDEETLASIPATSLSVNPANLKIVVGKSIYISVDVTPANATNKTVVWSSSNESVAKVDANGKVTGVSTGTATITAATVDGKISDCCEVTVVEDVQQKYQINSITIKDFDGNELTNIPNSNFLATISITNISSDSGSDVIGREVIVVLAKYDDRGAFEGLMYVSAEDMQIGSTIKLTLPIDNKNGDVAKLKAFSLSSFNSLTPLGNSVSFPIEQ